MKACALFLLSLFALVLLPAVPADACSCLPGSVPDTICKAYALAPQVFVGRVLAVTTSVTPPYNNGQYNDVRFAVDEAFKGVTAGSEVTIITAKTSGICGIMFTVGQAYLYTGAFLCGSGQLTRLAGNAQPMIDTLRSGVCANTPQAPVNLTAQAGSVDCAGNPVNPIVLRWGLMDVESYNVRKYSSGQTHPPVIATGVPTNSFSHLTNQSGVYFVSAVRNGIEGPNSNGASGQITAPGCPPPTPTMPTPTPTTPTATPTTSGTVQPSPTPATPTPTPSGVAPWQPGTFYSVGALVSHSGMTYRAIQAHTSQVGWEPPSTPALWQRQ
jgi:hypothetical protein